MCKSVDIFCKKDGDAPLNQARTGSQGLQLPHEGFCPDVLRRNFSTALAVGALTHRDRLPEVASVI